MITNCVKVNGSYIREEGEGKYFRKYTRNLKHLEVKGTKYYIQNQYSGTFRRKLENGNR